MGIFGIIFIIIAAAVPFGFVSDGDLSYHYSNGGNTAMLIIGILMTVAAIALLITGILKQPSNSKTVTPPSTTTQEPSATAQDK
ncbi:MAG: hypothetical protein LBV37_01995 [Mycoplasmataceae bacterium]|jgi:hypothetical protein|nr:hypothetical protein [Mycoplasmataceae bacterium]